MTIETTGNRAAYSGNGVTVNFAFPYKFLADADLVVVLKDDLTGVETVKTLSTHYTASGAGADNGGSITMLSAPATGISVIIYRDVVRKQTLDLYENSNLPAEEVEKALDKLMMVSQRLMDLMNRTIKLPEGFTGAFDPKLPGLISPNAIIAINATSDGLVMGPELGDIINAIAVTAQAVIDAQVAATAAANAASSASVQSTNASTYATNAFNSAAAAANSASGAATSEGNASTSESNADAARIAAEAAQVAAQNAADSTIWSKVSFLTFANSPRTITDADKGTLFVVDCTGGGVVLNLAQINTLTLTTPWTVGIKKSDASGNIVTINRGGTDTIDGAASRTISVPSSGATLVPNTTPNPDEWTSVLFGAGGGSAAPDLAGSLASPLILSSGTMIPFSGTSYFNIRYYMSNGGAVTIGTTPQIAPGTLIGQKLMLIFTSDTDTVELNDGNGLDLPAKFISGAKRKTELEWNGVDWSENFRR